jgi:hypothetical protein
LGRVLSRSRFAPLSVPLPSLVAAAALLVTLRADWQLFYGPEPLNRYRHLYSPNPVVESRVVADYIRSATAETDRIAVLGSEPQIYFYSGRRSVSPHIYAYPLMESHPHALTFQEQLIADIENHTPPIIVYVNVPHSWLVRESSAKRIFAWFENYRSAHYERVGVADIVSSTHTVYRWGDDAIRYVPTSPFFVEILARKRAWQSGGYTDRDRP